MKQYEARFGGVGRLLGAEGAGRLRWAHVCVIGLGGVGSWAVEALARSGIGEITLVDLDDVCIRNVNRQLPALDGAFGQPKVEVLARRVQAIHPDCRVHARQEFFLRSNAEAILADGFDYVLDAIDSLSKKCLLIALCRNKRIPVIASGAAAGRRDPTAVEVADLANSSNDRLLQKVRRMLRKDYGFPRGGRPFGIECVCSREPLVYPQSDGSVCCERGDGTDLRIDCNSGLGTASFVTGTFGFVAASRVIRSIADGEVAGPEEQTEQTVDGVAFEQMDVEEGHPAGRRIRHAGRVCSPIIGNQPG